MTPALPRYAELHCISHFSFLRGASSPTELVARALELGYEALALTDECSVAGVVRAHAALEEARAAWREARVSAAAPPRQAPLRQGMLRQGMLRQGMQRRAPLRRRSRLRNRCCGWSSAPSSGSRAARSSWCSRPTGAATGSSAG